MSRHRLVRGGVAAGLLVPALALGACGSSSKSTTTSTGNGASASTPATSAAGPHALAVSVSESGKTARYSIPATVPGGLVTLNLTNGGKSPHGAQLVRIIGTHSLAEVLKVLGGNNPKTPAWLRSEGGVGQIAPGASAKAVVNLPAGSYMVVDAGPGSNGPPAYKQFTVGSAAKGPLPATPLTITAASPAKDKYQWKISGPLHAGDNTITFKSEGKNTIHLIAAARLTSNPSKAQLIKALNSHGQPKYIDPSSFAATAIIDGGSSQVTPLALTKPGRYVLFCPLSDRDGGKAHLEEGLITRVTVK